MRYHTCRSSNHEDRKLPIMELKWDARTLTDIPGNTSKFPLYHHYGSIFVHFGLQDNLTYMYYTSKCLYMSLLYKYIQ
jgi:hypothetical protein